MILLGTFEWIWSAWHHALATNQFLGAGLMLGIGGLLLNSLRKGWVHVWHWCKSQILIEITIRDTDEAFNWVRIWLDAQPSSQKIRSVEISLMTKKSDHEQESRPCVIVSPGVGIHFMFFRSRPVWLIRRRESESSAMSLLAKHAGTLGGGNESITFRIATRDRAVVAQLFNDIRDYVLPKDGSVFRLLCMTGYNNPSWRCLKSVPRACTRKVILPKGTLEELRADLIWFRQARDWFTTNGIPYHRSYVFEGMSGAGKTSTAAVLAEELGFDLAIASLNNRFSDDRQFQGAVGELPARTILLLEDVDCLFKERRAVDNSNPGITFSGFLNAIDGVASVDGTIIIMTTNHFDKLDPALTRPGRMDVRVTFCAAQAEQAAHMFRNFFPSANGTAEVFGKEAARKAMSMSAVQQHLMKYRESPGKALSSLEG